VTQLPIAGDANGATYSSYVLNGPMFVPGVDLYLYRVHFHFHSVSK